MQRGLQHRAQDRDTYNSDTPVHLTARLWAVGPGEKTQTAHRVEAELVSPVLEV